MTVLLVDRGPVAANLLAFPTFMEFFTTRERLEIAGIPQVGQLIDGWLNILLLVMEVNVLLLPHILDRVRGTNIHEESDAGAEV